MEGKKELCELIGEEGGETGIVSGSKREAIDRRGIQVLICCSVGSSILILVAFFLLLFFLLSFSLSLLLVLFLLLLLFLLVDWVAIYQ